MEASTLSALGAAVAGAHVGHACAYAIAGRVPGVAHGFAAAVMLSSLMRATFETDPPAHARYAEALAAPLGVELSQRDPREQLPTVIEHLLGRLSAPRDLTDLGLSEDDVAPMAAAALRQERLMAGAPVPIGAAELEALLRDALRWPSSSSATPSR
jgi:alcohol dehydrogenase class IV